MAENPAMRASDADRERVADALRDAYAQGRITVEEFHERVDAAYTARTFGELEPLTADLPARDLTDISGSVRPNRSAQRPNRSAQRFGSGAWTPSEGGQTSGPVSRTREVALIWSGWVSLALLLSVIYLITDLGGYFWPAWPLLATGLIGVRRTVAGTARRRR